MPQVSTPEQPKPASPKSILLMGPPGSFKTTFVLQFPGLYIIDCDLNLDGPEKFLRAKGQKISYLYDSVSMKDGTQIPADKCYERIVDLVHDAAKLPDVQWVAIDGLTAINEYIIQKIMREQRVSYMEARNWSTFKSDAIGLLFSKLRHIKKNVIVTAHEVRIEINDPKNMMNKILVGWEPFIQSKVSEMLGGFFTDVWRLQAEQAPGNKMEWKLQVTKIPFYDQLKNTLGLSGELKNATYETLKPYLEGTK